MELSFYIAKDDNCPTSGKPTGMSVLEDYGQVDYIVGDGQRKELLHDVEVPEAGCFLKVYADNDDFYDHAIDVQMMIEL